jgi:hypothetical protein
MKIIMGLICFLFLISIYLVAEPVNLDGNYIYLPEQSEDVFAAIDETVSTMSFITRPIARRRLRNTNEPYQSIDIITKTDSVFIATDGKPAVKTNLDGSSKRWTREDGEEFEVTTIFKDNSLRQSFVAEDGKRVNEYIGSEKGLELRVTITSSKLKQPLTYRLQYQRIDGQ